jgi:hypothetical protein
MDRLRFSFTDLHPDAPDLPGDLDWLLRFVAGTFEARVDGELLFDEVDFPVLELARVLEAWIARDMPEGRDLDYELTGGAPRTLTIQRTPGGWRIDSVHRPRKKPEPAPLTDEEVRSGVRSFIDDLARETLREYDYDVRALLRRVDADAPS